MAPLLNPPSVPMGGDGDTVQAAAFIASRHLAYFRPGMYVRHLIASGTGLKSWLFAAIKLIVPQFPIAAELEGRVTRLEGALVEVVGRLDRLEKGKTA